MSHTPAGSPFETSPDAVGAAIRTAGSPEDGVARHKLIEAIESSSEGFALFDSDDRLVFCNRHFQDFHPGL